MTRPHLVAAVSLACLVASPAAATEDPLDVVATFSILGDMASRVGGDRIRVTTLVGPGGDAHVYQPSPADARAISEADLLLVNGLGFEGFLDRLAEASGYTGPVVTAAAGIVPVAAGAGGGGHADEHASEEAHGHDDAHAEEAHGHDDAHAAEEAHGHDDAHAEEEHEHASDDGHDHGPVDPHAWQNLGNALAYVEAIAGGLCGVDPKGCADYRLNAESYRAEIAALDAEIRDRIAAVPEERRAVITSHDAFAYFGSAYGVRFFAPQGVSTESEASARDVASLIEQIRASGAKVVFVESIADPRLVERIAAETGAAVGGTLYSDALSGPDEPASTYLGMMRHNADAIIAGMQGGS